MSAADDFFSENYAVILDEPLTGQTVNLPNDAGQQCCRFCRRSTPSATFKKRAHAVPELLGNKALFCPNECDACNSRFGQRYENDLGAGTLFERSVTGVPGKRRQPTYAEGEGLRIEWVEGRQEITITNPELFERAFGKTDAFCLAGHKLKAWSQSFVPQKAAAALVKIACSLCPPNTVEQIQPTIAWLMKPRIATRSPFCVFHSFAVGDNPYGAGRALLLKRTGKQPMPFLLCVIASGSDRFQYAVPFTTEDALWTHSQLDVSCRALIESGQTFHYPNWTISAEIEYDQWDWSSDERTRREFDVSINAVGSIVESTEQA